MNLRADQAPERLAANQVVAHNLRRARKLKGWTQDEAAEALASYTGERWSRVGFSAAERSVESGRVRRFDADLLVALSAAFDLPITFFLEPPPGVEWVGAGSGSDVEVEEFLGLLRGMTADLRKRPANALDLRAEARFHRKRAEAWRSASIPVPDASPLEREEEALRDDARAEVLEEEASRLDEAGKGDEK